HALIQDAACARHFLAGRGTPQSFGVFGSQHVLAWAFIAGVHFALGEPQLAEAASARSIQHARQLRHPMSLALALVTELLTPIPGGLKADPALAEEVVRFCSRQGQATLRCGPGLHRARLWPSEGIRAKASTRCAPPSRLLTR